MERSFFGCGLAALCNLCNLRMSSSGDSTSNFGLVNRSETIAEIDHVVLGARRPLFKPDPKAPFAHPDYWGAIHSGR
jgi:hypothetical protein